MPDQSSAATEHAILQEITAPLQSLPDDPVAAVQADFPSSLRGYDRMAVDAYVRQTSQLVAELHATRSPEAAVRRALERVGEQISGVLQRAHETAEQITTQSRSEAEDRLEQVRAEAAEIAAAAQQRVSDLDADTDRIWAERNRIVEDARDLASQLLALAETAAEEFGATAATAHAPEDLEPEHPPEDLEPEHAPEDLERTAAFDPIETVGAEAENAPEAANRASQADAADDAERSDPASSEPTRELRRSSSVIPPASQAANRRPR